LREDRAKKVLKNLNGFGYLIEFGDLRALARGTIVQPHIAWVVINDLENKKKLEADFGHIPTTGEFIVKYLIPGALAYETRQTVTPKEAIDLIRRSGGVPVLAHPCWNAAKKTGKGIIFDDSLIDGLVDSGIQGIEAYAHRDNEEDTKVCVKHFEEYAKSKGLLITGGSDFHGFGSAGKELGFSNFYLKIPYSILEALKSKRSG
jgi:predicted metal-dependent phosphoesterase TrpH